MFVFNMLVNGIEATNSLKRSCSARRSLMSMAMTGQVFGTMTFLHPNMPITRLGKAQLRGLGESDHFHWLISAVLLLNPL
jgi:hypothetical protein